MSPFLGNKKLQSYGLDLSGYDIAFRIDQELNDLLEKNPPSRENYIQWMKLTRTLQTSIDLLEMLIRDRKDQEKASSTSKPSRPVVDSDDDDIRWF